MTNTLIFLVSCALITGFTWWFYYLGQGALTAWITLMSLLANLFVLKQIELVGLNATASDVFAIGGLLSLNLLRERFGSQAAQRAIWTSFTCLLFFVISSQLHLLYIPNSYDTAHSAYEFLLSSSPRLLIASLTTFLIVDQFDSRLYGVMRRQWPTKSILLISSVTMSISQLLDTVLFSFLGLYGMIQAIFEIMIVAYGIKILAIANTIPWSFFTQRLFRLSYVNKTN